MPPKPISVVRDEVKRLGHDPRHSELWRYVNANFDAIVQMLVDGATYPSLAAGFREAGVPDRSGKPPTANTIRLTVNRVRADKVRRRKKAASLQVSPAADPGVRVEAAKPPSVDDVKRQGREAALRAVSEAGQGSEHRGRK